MQAYESIVIKHAFAVSVQAAGVVHEGRSVLRVCIH
jgi:hypothetical protein